MIDYSHARSSGTEGEKMRKFQSAEWQEVNGTSLRGYVTATRREMERVFGAPDTELQDKVTTEWRIKFDCGTVATIYDWKRYEDGAPGMDEEYQWHIGGHDYKAVERIEDALLAYA